MVLDTTTKHWKYAEENDVAGFLCQKARLSTSKHKLCIDLNLISNLSDPCPDGFRHNRYNGHCYRYFNEKKNYDSANQDCNYLGAKMVTILDKYEELYVKCKLK